MPLLDHDIRRDGEPRRLRFDGRPDDYGAMARRPGLSDLADLPMSEQLRDVPGSLGKSNGSLVRWPGWVFNGSLPDEHVYSTCIWFPNCHMSGKTYVVIFLRARLMFQG